MSLFHLREYWAAPRTGGLDESEGEGISKEETCAGGLCVANIDNDPSGQVKIITGNFRGFLRVFLPHRPEWDPEDLLLEHDLKSPILQLEAGRFIPGSSILALAVLHPRSIAVYTIGAVGERGGQGYHRLQQLYSHSLEHTSANMCYGPFGSVSGKDYIAVQSMDGIISVFEQDRPAFSRPIPSFLFPGPFCYVTKIDAFITSGTDMEVRSFKYHSLASGAGEQIRSDWSVNTGDMSQDLSVARFSRSLPGSQVDILALGEHSLLALKENGGIRLQKRLNYVPSCMCPYDVRDQAGGSQNLLVASHAGSIHVYRDMQMVWAAWSSATPVALRVAAFGGMRGLIVSLAADGALSISYLGTDPSLSLATHISHTKEPNYAESDARLRELQKIIRASVAHSSSHQQRMEPDDKLEIRKKIPDRLDEAADGSLIHQMTVRLALRATAGGMMKEISLSYLAEPPLILDRASDSLPTLIGGRRTPTVLSLPVGVDNELVPIGLGITASASCFNERNEPRTVLLQLEMPMSLVCTLVPPIKKAAAKFTIDSNRPPIPISELFADVMEQSTDPSVAAMSATVLSFMFPCGESASVIVSKNAGRYRIQGTSLSALGLVARQVDSRLRTMLDKGSMAGDEPLKISTQDALPLDAWFGLMEAHLALRNELHSLREELETRAKQFRMVLKRLLVRYREKNPMPMNGMDRLLNATHDDIKSMAANAELLEKKLALSANQLGAATVVIQVMVRGAAGLSEAAYKVFCAHVSEVVRDGWEEATDASVTSLLRTVLAKSAKDQAAVSPPLEMPKDVSRLKNHMVVMLDRIISGGAELV